MEQTLIIIAGAPTIATERDALRGFIAFKMSNWEMAGSQEKSLDSRP